MPKLTKAQQKRLVREIASKTKKLYTMHTTHLPISWKPVVNTKDMEAIEKLTAKWIQRIG